MNGIYLLSIFKTKISRILFLTLNLTKQTEIAILNIQKIFIGGVGEYALKTGCKSLACSELRMHGSGNLQNSPNLI